MSVTATPDTAPEPAAAPAGLMMDVELNVPLILERMFSVHGASRVHAADATGSTSTATFQDVLEEAKRLASSLEARGIRPGDRVGSFAWNTREHLEIYLAVLGMGATLHTINLRLSPTQIAFTINDADDKLIFVDSSLIKEFKAFSTEISTDVQVVVIGDEQVATDVAITYESLKAAGDGTFEWPNTDERAAASLCYTSGTTGDPKGVLYSHRSIVLHALSMSGADVFQLREQDRVLAMVPLFHVMGWGLPFICGLTGADLVLPGPRPDPQRVLDLIQEHEVTWSAGVPTLWLDVLEASQTGMSPGKRAFASLRTVLCGGTMVPEALVAAYAAHDVRVVEGWGMTEVFPGAAVVTPGSSGRGKAGRISPLYQMRVVAENGSVVPSDGTSVGELEIRGPVVASAYVNSSTEDPDRFRDGWLRTGDIGAIDAQGWINITDRLKDAIKSGGEWISSLDLESALMAHPGVREAAVVSRPDERWGERPVAYVVPRHESRTAQVDDLRAFLADQVPKWWIPEDIRPIAEIPRTSTGKYDKKALRDATYSSMNALGNHTW